MNKYDFINLCDKTIISIETHSDDKRYVHYMGFGYDTGDKEDKPCRFTEYTFMYCELAKAINQGIFNWEEQNQEFYKQYVEDCDKERIKEIYLHYVDGNAPKLILDTAVNEETPDGTYIFVTEAELDALKRELNGNLRHELNGSAGYNDEVYNFVAEKMVVLSNLIEEIEKNSEHSIELIVKKIQESSNEENEDIINDILYGYVDETDTKEAKIANKILDIWQNSKDKAAIEKIFYLFTGVTLIQYLGRCKNKMMKEN